MFCSECNRDHGLYFSPEVLAVYHKIKSTDDPLERRHLIIELAEEFAMDTDESDAYIDDAVHELIAEARATLAAFERSALLLGRFIVREIEVEEGELQSEPAPTNPPPVSSAN